MPRQKKQGSWGLKTDQYQAGEWKITAQVWPIIRPYLKIAIKKKDKEEVKR
jgi:hypothetical protein